MTVRLPRVDLAAANSRRLHTKEVCMRLKRNSRFCAACGGNWAVSAVYCQDKENLNIKIIKVCWGDCSNLSTFPCCCPVAKVKKVFAQQDALRIYLIFLLLFITKWYPSKQPLILGCLMLGINVSQIGLQLNLNWLKAPISSL